MDDFLAKRELGNQKLPPRRDTQPPYENCPLSANRYTLIAMSYGITPLASLHNQLTNLGPRGYIPGKS
jgi:hypothetical protein